MNRLVPVAAVAALLALSVPAVSQVGPDDPCTAGARWHLQQAMRWSERDDQAYHVGAADAMLRLSAMNDLCSDWSLDAHRPDSSGDRSATAAESAQASEDARVMAL